MMPECPRELMEELPLNFGAHAVQDFEIQRFLSLTSRVQRQLERLL